jgi:hypothetical protein
MANKSGFGTIRRGRSSIAELGRQLGRQLGLRPPYVSGASVAAGP